MFACFSSPGTLEFSPVSLNPPVPIPYSVKRSHASLEPENSSISFSKRPRTGPVEDSSSDECFDLEPSEPSAELRDSSVAPPSRLRKRMRELRPADKNCSDEEILQIPRADDFPSFNRFSFEFPDERSGPRRRKLGEPGKIPQHHTQLEDFENERFEILDEAPNLPRLSPVLPLKLPCPLSPSYFPLSFCAPAPSLAPAADFDKQLVVYKENPAVAALREKFQQWRAKQAESLEIQNPWEKPLIEEITEEEKMKE